MERIFRFITNLVDSFRLNNEKEDFSIISENKILEDSIISSLLFLTVAIAPRIAFMSPL